MNKSLILAITSAGLFAANLYLAASREQSFLLGVSLLWLFMAVKNYKRYKSGK